VTSSWSLYPHTTTCFGPICGPSLDCDLTSFQGQLYKMCGVFFGYWGLGGGGEGGEISFVSIVGTMTWGYYKWIIVSFLCTRVKVGFYSYDKGMLLLVTSVTI